MNKYLNIDNLNHGPLIKKIKVYNNSPNILNRALKLDPPTSSNLVKDILPLLINSENPIIENIIITLKTKVEPPLVLISLISIYYFKYYLL